MRKAVAGDMVLSTLWKIMCDSLRDDAKELKLTCPEFAVQAIAEAEQFCRQSTPKDHWEHMRRISAVSMITNSWSTHVLTKMMRDHFQRSVLR